MKLKLLRLSQGLGLCAGGSYGCPYSEWQVPVCCAARQLQSRVRFGKNATMRSCGAWYQVWKVVLCCQCSHFMQVARWAALLFSMSSGFIVQARCRRLCPVRTSLTAGRTFDRCRLTLRHGAPLIDLLLPGFRSLCGIDSFVPFVLVSPLYRPYTMYWTVLLAFCALAYGIPVKQQALWTLGSKP